MRVGQKATFTVDAYNGKTFTATVSKISQTDIDNSWNTSKASGNTSSAAVIYYSVTLDVDDPEKLLMPSMTARVEIETANKTDAVAVPLSALKTDKQGVYVIVVKEDGTTENRYVQTGIYGDEFVEITDGLVIDEKVDITMAKKQPQNDGRNERRGRPPMH